MSAQNFNSPLVSRLMSTLEERHLADTRALQTLATKVLHEEGRYLQVEVRGRLMYPISAANTCVFLYEAGIDRFYGTTWLDMDNDGELVADVPLQPAATKLHDRHVRLGNLVWAQCAEQKSPVNVGGIDVIMLHIENVGRMLKLARSIAKQMPEFATLTAQRRMDAMTSELGRHPVAEPAEPPAGPAAKRTSRRRAP